LLISMLIIGYCLFTYKAHINHNLQKAVIKFIDARVIELDYNLILKCDLICSSNGNQDIN